jgi:hypothetical protein
MKTKLFTVLVVSGIFTLMACSVKQGAVAKRPPTIDASQVSNYSVAVTYGKFVPDVFSLLIWPSDWSEAEWETNVESIKTSSRELTKIIVGIKMKGIEAAGLYRAFSAANCVSKYAEVDADWPDDYAETHQMIWKQIAPVAADQPGYNEYQKAIAELAGCNVLQDKRFDDLAFVDQITNQNPSPIAALQEQIGKALGSGKTVAADHPSSFIVTKNGVGVKQIRLHNFAGSGRDQEISKGDMRIHDIVLENSGKHLMFTVPDANEPGLEYVLDVYRSSDLAQYPDVDSDGNAITTSMALYAGDVGVLKNGKVVAKGTAQLVGPLVPFAE